jgi:hypothetical protein
MKTQHTGDRAFRDGGGAGMSVLAHALSLLADDEDFVKEILRKVTSAHKRPDEGAGRRERFRATSTQPELGSALRDGRM